MPPAGVHERSPVVGVGLIVFLWRAQMMSVQFVSRPFLSRLDLGQTSFTTWSVTAEGMEKIIGAVGIFFELFLY